MQAITEMPLAGSGSRIIVVSCPEAKYEIVLKFLRQNDCQVTEEDGSTSYPSSTPGTIVRGLRCRDGLTQAGLSKLTDIPTRHISEMENGKRPIGKQNARKLAAAFNTDPRMFLFA